MELVDPRVAGRDDATGEFLVSKQLLLSLLLRKPVTISVELRKLCIDEMFVFDLSIAELPVTTTAGAARGLEVALLLLKNGDPLFKEGPVIRASMPCPIAA